jgi:hypothetical protein
MQCQVPRRPHRCPKDESGAKRGVYVSRNGKAMCAGSDVDAPSVMEIMCQGDCVVVQSMYHVKRCNPNTLDGYACSGKNLSHYFGEQRLE